MTKPSMWDDLTVADVVSNVFVEIATLGIVFFLGAMVGSFVNVVLYRLPRRINLLWPPSRCPICSNRLKLTDNVPVVGYLRLGGKCRFCGAAIPRSYLRAEVGFGLLLLAVTYLEVHTGGWNLPLRTPNHYVLALWTIWYPQPELLRIAAYHALLAVVLATLFLFARRGERFPGSVVVVGLLLGILLPLRYPGLHQVPWAGGGAWQSAGFTEAVIGAAAGVVAGRVFGLTWPARAVESGDAARLALPTRWDLAAVLAVAGAWLGWQAVVSVAVLTGAAGLLRPGARAVSHAVGAVAVQIACWRLLTAHAPWWPGPHTPPLLMAGWVALAIVLSVARRSRFTAPDPERPTSETLPAAEAPSPEISRTGPATPEADSAADSRSEDAS